MPFFLYILRTFYTFSTLYMLLVWSVKPNSYFHQR
nr:MAG TPA: hypothetical protein [Caudoviricetes sp.]